MKEFLARLDPSPRQGSMASLYERSPRTLLVNANDTVPTSKAY